MPLHSGLVLAMLQIQGQNCQQRSTAMQAYSEPTLQAVMHTGCFRLYVTAFWPKARQHLAENRAPKFAGRHQCNA